MRVLLFLVVLSVGTVRAEGPQILRAGTVELTLTAESVTARDVPSARLIWRRPHPLRTATQAVTQDDLLLLGGSLLANRPDGEGGQVVALDVRTGKPRWKSPTNGLPQKIGTLGNMVYVTYCGSGAYSYCWSVGFDKRRGRKLWDAYGPFVTRSGDLALFGHSTHIAGYVPDELEFTRANGATGKAESFTFRVPPRPGCGRVNDPTNAQGGTWVGSYEHTQRFIYAVRQDDCGPFVARFDWHALPSQTPLVYPRTAPYQPK